MPPLISDLVDLLLGGLIDGIALVAALFFVFGLVAIGGWHKVRHL